MKKTKLLMLLILSGLATSVSAQESLDQAIDRLKTEISRRETIDRDQTTPTAQRLTNRANLESARTALLNTVQAKIGALEIFEHSGGFDTRGRERRCSQRLANTSQRKQITQ